MTLSQVKRIPLAMGVEMILGDYTHTVGGANGTIAIGAGRVYHVTINNQSTTEAEIPHGAYSVSVSGAINTVTLYANATTTAGTFCIIVGTGT